MNINISSNYNILVEQFNTITSNVYGNLAVNILALAAAMYIVWYLYRKIAKRDMFTFENKNYGEGFTGIIKQIFSVLIYVFKYGIMFPLYSFLMFALLSVSIFFLSTGMTVPNVLYISIIIISVVRLLAYIKEDTAQELAKMLPFGLIFLVLTRPDVAQQYALPNLANITNSIPTLEQYILFLIGLEFVLRVLYIISANILTNHKKTKKD
ncbi:hypothetical protein J7J90_03515 [Candidatus Micrarchaeota archaeon]|nr:hypothetical protein [Candidatus Micrarchaeota archaeon]